MNKLRAFVRLMFVMAVLSVSGCVVAPPLATPSGNPEILIEGVSTQEIRDVLTSSAMGWGYVVRDVTDYSARYEKKETNFAVSGALGGSYDPTMVWRITYNYAPMGNGVKVMAYMHAVVKPGTSFEQSIDKTRDPQYGAKLQPYLENLKKNLEARKAISSRGKVGIGFDEKFVVNKLVPGCTSWVFTRHRGIRAVV